MDFGSSHVYAGEQSPVYYSSVPKDATLKTANLNINNSPSTYDPVYEAIKDVNKIKLNGETQHQQEAVYDLVAGEQRNEGTAWDEIPRVNKPPPVPAKPAMYAGVKPDSDALSMAEKLRKALEQRAKKKEKEVDVKVVCEASDEQLSKVPPKKPPRKKRNPRPIRSAPPPPTLSAPLPPPTLPSRGCTYDIIAEEEPAKLTHKPEPVDSLISFNDNCIIPVLSPPPIIGKPQRCLPNASYDLFDALLSIQGTDAGMSLPILQPTVVQSSIPNMNGLATNNTQSAGGRMSPSSFISSDSEASKDSFDSPPLNRTNGFLNVEKPIIAVQPNNYVPAGQGFLAVSERNGVSSTSGSQNPFPSIAMQNTVNPFQLSNHSNGIDKLFMNGFDEPVLTPTAPSVTPSMVRKDAELQQNQLVDALATDNDTNTHPPDAFLIDGTSLQPTAPARSNSMLQRDRIQLQRSSSSASSTDTTYAATADTNVVCVKLGIVADNQGSFISAAVPSHCASCRGINNSLSEKWECKFCTAINKTPIQTIPPSSAHDVTYVVQPPTNTFSPPETLIVFCIDTSGSMGVTTKSLQQAITDQLNLIEANLPNTRVAMVTFNDDVHFLGDGSPEQRLTLTEFQLFDFDYLSHVGAVAPMPGLIRDTRLKLTKAVLELKETGRTALGPALLLSTALAAKLPGSQVIVCTDGRANVGVGSLETEDDYSICHHFYDQATAMAATRGVIVNVFSIAGSDCRIVQLGKIADKTAGKVSIVEANKISEELLGILSDSVLATNVSIDLVTHRQLFFQHGTDVIGSNIAQFIGNITNNSEVTFRYGVRKDEEFSTIASPSEAPFQLKIIYRLPDGGVYMRVLTQVKPVTDNKELAEAEMNPAVIGTYASHYAARLALQGDLENAKEVTSAHKNLVSKGMSLKSNEGALINESLYESVQQRMDDIGSELTKADTTSTCSSERDPNTYCDPDLIDEDDEDEPGLPPALPPRRQNSATIKPDHHGSTSSIQAKLAKLPNVSKFRIKGKKRNKKKTAMGYKDKTAVQMFNFSKASSASFA